MNSNKKILLIEDDHNDRFFFMNALSKIENTTLYDTAQNGQEALDKLESALILPDIIFTDINMPLMDGIECLTEITNRPQLKHIPVVVLSSDTDKIDVVRNLGAKAFIKKPMDNERLREQLEQVIHSDFIVNSVKADCIFHASF